MSNNRSKKNKFAYANAGKSAMSISEYLEKKYEWESLPGKIRDGVMYVLFHGHWVEEKELIEVCPKPFVHSFLRDKNNCDKTQQWKL